MPGRPGAGVLGGDAAGGARRRSAPGAVPHPHPPRPRRGDGGAGAPLARAPGLRARARRPAPDRPLAPAGQRRASLRRGDGAALGRDRPGARGERAARSPAARTCSACASPTRPAMPPTTSATCTKRAAPPSSATSPRCESPRRTWSSPQPRRPTSTSRPGSSRSRSSSPGGPSALRSPISARSTIRSSTWRRSACACARRPSWRSSSPSRNTSTATAFASPRTPTRSTAEALIHAVPPEYQWRGLDRYWRKRAEREAE